MNENLRGIPLLIGQLFRTVQDLNRLYPDRPFTPDGHLIGSISEVVAADTYGLTLEKCSNEGFDAKTKAGQTVEIKLTGGKSVAISSGAEPPELLIVLKLDSNKGFTEIYNGSFPLNLWRKKKASKRGVKTLNLSELRPCNPKLLSQTHPLDKLNELFNAFDLVK